MSKLSLFKQINWGISVALGLSVWIFFAIFYRHHMHYQEQMQLFLTSSEYVAGIMVRPGGLSTYLGAFFTQFFYDSFLGAAGVALLMVLLQRLVLDATNHISRKPDYALLTCLPSIGYSLLLLDENYLLSGLVALVLSLLAVAFANRIKGNEIRQIYFLLMIPMLYWLIGIACLVFVLLVLLTEWLRKDKIKTARLATLSIASLLLLALCPYMAKAVVVQYPLKRFWLAGDYYRYVLQYPLWPVYLFLFTAFIPLLIKYLPERSDTQKPRWGWIGVQFVLLVCFAGGGISTFADWKKEELMAYDHFARMQKWNSILAMADKKAPTGPFTVSMLNLALSKTGYLPEFMFTYYQNGAEGLIPVFMRDYLQPLMAGEIYYHLGLINTAQRYAFEGMEAIPDYQKSVRSIKRLAETNLINGRYEAAAKYLSLLENTLFYREWAKETKTYLKDEERINAHPEWGTLRAYRPENDFLFSEQEKDQMLGLLFQHNPSNKMAYEYLMAYCLLTKDLTAFLNYYPLGKDIQYRQMPRSYQEALIYLWGLSHTDMNSIPYLVSDNVKKRVQEYGKIYTNNQHPEPLLEKNFSDTYWYYLHFRK